MIAPTSVRPNGPVYIFVSCMLAAQPAPSRDTAMMAPRLCLMTLLPNGGHRSIAAVRRQKLASSIPSIDKSQVLRGGPGPGIRPPPLPVPRADLEPRKPDFFHHAGDAFPTSSAPPSRAAAARPGRSSRPRSHGAGDEPLVGLTSRGSAGRLRANPVQPFVQGFPPEELCLRVKWLAARATPPAWSGSAPRGREGSHARGGGRNAGPAARGPPEAVRNACSRYRRAARCRSCAFRSGRPAGAPPAHLPPPPPWLRRRPPGGPTSSSS